MARAGRASGHDLRATARRRRSERLRRRREDARLAASAAFPLSPPPLPAVEGRIAPPRASFLRAFAPPREPFSSFLAAAGREPNRRENSRRHRPHRTRLTIPRPCRAARSASREEVASRGGAEARRERGSRRARKTRSLRTDRLGSTAILPAPCGRRSSPHPLRERPLLAAERAAQPGGCAARAAQKCAITPAIGRKLFALLNVLISMRRRTPLLPVTPPKPMSFGPTSTPAP